MISVSSCSSPYDNTARRLPLALSSPTLGLVTFALPDWMETALALLSQRMLEPHSPRSGRMMSSATADRSPMASRKACTSCSTTWASEYWDSTVTKNDFFSKAHPLRMVAVSLPVTFSFPWAGRSTFAIPPWMEIALFSDFQVIAEPLMPSLGSSMSSVIPEMSPRSSSSLSADTMPVSSTSYMALISCLDNARL